MLQRHTRNLLGSTGLGHCHARTGIRSSVRSKSLPLQHVSESVLIELFRTWFTFVYKVMHFLYLNNMCQMYTLNRWSKLKVMQKVRGIVNSVPLEMKCHVYVNHSTVWLKPLNWNAGFFFCNTAVHYYQKEKGVCWPSWSIVVAVSSSI
jgi:hypothetical protein